MLFTKEHDAERGLAPAPLRQFEKTDVYWQAASAGTQLPQIDRKIMDDTKDKDMVFAPVCNTGVFYTNTCKNTNAHPGVLTHFFAICNMKKNCSHSDRDPSACCSPQHTATHCNTAAALHAACSCPTCGARCRAAPHACVLALHDVLQHVFLPYMMFSRMCSCPT